MPRTPSRADAGQELDKEHSRSRFSRQICRRATASGAVGQWFESTGVRSNYARFAIENPAATSAATPAATRSRFQAPAWRPRTRSKGDQTRRAKGPLRDAKRSIGDAPSLFAASGPISCCYLCCYWPPVLSCHIPALVGNACQSHFAGFHGHQSRHGLNRLRPKSVANGLRSRRSVVRIHWGALKRSGGIESSHR